MPAASRGYAFSGPSLPAFDPLDPAGAKTLGALVGLTSGETLVGMDFRAQNGMLYGPGVTA